MNILYNNARSYNQQHTTTSPKHRKYILEIQTSCNGTNEHLIIIHSATSLVSPAISTCWSETNKDWDEA